MRRHSLLLTVAVAGLLQAAACDRAPQPSREAPPPVAPRLDPKPNNKLNNAGPRQSQPNSASDERPSSPQNTVPPAVTESFRLPAPQRLVAIGDLHGDLEATRDVLRLAGAIDATDRWVGDKLVVVQTGDQIDRGDDDREVLDLLRRLQVDAKTHGGAVHVLAGNHETMNAMGDFRYVTSKAFSSFAGADPRALPVSVSQRLPNRAHGRAAAFLPGGNYAKQLARYPVTLIVGGSLFVHGGVLPEHLDYGLERLNREVRRWLEGIGPLPPAIASEAAPVWTRLYSEPTPSKEACKTLEQVLSRAGVVRMVVGHTVQSQGITSACDERVYRIDVGMSGYYGGDSVAALEIVGNAVRILKREKSPAPSLPAAAE